MMNDTVREAVGVFHDERALQSVIDDLLVSGFDHADLSILAGERAVERKLGHKYERVAELEDNPVVPRQVYVDVDSRTEAKSALIGGLIYVGAVASVGMIVASGGTVAAALVAAAVAGGAGAVIGAGLGRFMDKRHARRLQAQLERGGLVLWISTKDAEHEAGACQILRRHGGEDVHVHDVPVERYPRIDGVSGRLCIILPER